MSKYKVTDKYTVVGESGEPKLTKKYRRKSSTGRGDLHPKSRSLSLGSLNAPQLTVVEITEPLRSPKLPLGKRSSMEIDYLQFHHLAAKGNPLVYDNMYGYKDQYDSVGKHTEKGIEFLEKFGNFLKKRCDIETSYASELKRLVKNFQPKRKEEDEYQFTWARAFLDMLKEVHDMAGQHEVIAENTQGQLIGELQKCVGELKTDRRKFLQEGSRVQNQMKDSLKLLENSKKNYERKYNEADKALDAYRKADADINLSRAEVEKTRHLSNKRSSEAEDSKNEYASQLQTTNNFQREYYNTNMPQVFQQLQDLDERRINKIKSVIETSASIESSVLPIIKTCIDGMNKASESINVQEDCKLVIDKHRTGFPIPGDIPFEDLSTGGQMNNHNVIKTNNTPINTTKGGTVGGKGKKRGGLFGLFKNTNTDEQREDFGNIPPAQRKAKLCKRIDEIRKQIAHETAEREGMIKMKEVYTNNTALGDPNSIDKKLDQNAEKLNHLQGELKKNQDFLHDAESEMSMRRHGSDDSMTHSITSEGSNNIQGSAPGTPVQQHIPPEELYEPVEEPSLDPEPDTFLNDNENDDEFSYPVIGSCRALYPFDAINEGSVSMQENEEMWVLEQDQGDGWTRVRKNDNSEGFVPTSYVQCHYYDQDAV
ncbi:cdc42-interacting protein 4 homolog isoform X3 [Ruditapes philippinarum]|uniref:cdc42-interacting protein 4 homolog isoform X3 n=1 Tax=Ruditapes philippinarum TaxID=129788 RepID=UPI00295BE76A|nr:cdc42-interacting protein 4 homolog isoform X3 [Ruditapes philippinarum]